MLSSKVLGAKYKVWPARLLICFLLASLASGVACSDSSDGGLDRPAMEDNDNPLATQPASNPDDPGREAFIYDAQLQLGQLETRIDEIETAVIDQGDQVQPDTEVRLTQIKGQVEEIQSRLVMAQTLDESEYASMKSEVETGLHSAMTEADALAGELGIGREGRAGGTSPSS